MAGRFADLVDDDGEFDTVFVSFEDLTPMPAERALEECWEIIYALAEGDTERIRQTLHGLGFDDPWTLYNRAPMRSMRTKEST